MEYKVFVWRTGRVDVLPSNHALSADGALLVATINENKEQEKVLSAFGRSMQGAGLCLSMFEKEAAFCALGVSAKLDANEAMEELEMWVFAVQEHFEEYYPEFTACVDWSRA